jgi:hypothetical protein
LLVFVLVTPLAAPVNVRSDFVPYWMIVPRRTTSNFGLQCAVERAVELKKPLAV